MKTILMSFTLLTLTSCNFFEAMRQTDPNRSDKPVFGSDRWREDREERRRARIENENAAIAFRILTTPQN